MARKRARSRIRYVGRRFRRGVHKISMKTKVVNTIALVIGVSPLIETGLTRLPSGNLQGFGSDLVDGYTGGLAANGQFNWGTFLKWYGPIGAAILFQKAMKHLKGKTLIG